MTLDAAPVLRHRGLGISSFILSLLTAAMFILDTAFTAYAHETGTATQGVNAVIGIIMFFAWVLGLISIGLGIAGLRDRTAKRAFSITGVSISGVVFALSLGLMVLGLSQKA